MKTLTAILLGISLLASGTLAASIERVVLQEVAYEFEDATFRSKLVVPVTQEMLPPLFMVPSWMGVQEETLAKAAKVALMGYVVYVADVYGEDTRPENAREAARAAGALREDRPLMRRRGEAALAHFREHLPQLGVREGGVGAIGFCFGGGMLLEMARGGADLAGLVSFHGDLASPTLEEDADKVTAKVLVLHGAADPYVPPADVEQFQQAMEKAGVDWQVISFGGAVHSFTNPKADAPGQAMYDERTAARAFAYMRMFFGEIFGE
ncbi:MAG: dienelactone hydrolase family protein [Puniceicoccaceae bacterium]|nr:MAG: dienelactone hydrolase family protein [Puniceicoccaceae bacterium]